MVVEALLVMVVVGIVDARLERLVEWEEMWDGTTPESAALLGEIGRASCRERV